MNTGARWFFAACLVMILTASAACGRKTAPLIPDSPRPETVKDIKVATRDASAFLSWPIPIRNVEGRNMNPADIKLFRIYRAEFGRDRKKPRYKPFVDINMTNPAPAVVRNGIVAWTDRDLKYGQVYGYRIRAVSVRGGISVWSEEARITPLLPLAIPAGIAAQSGDGYNVLTWASVTTQADGSSYSGGAGYNVYRGAEKDGFEETPLNKEPLSAPSYKDTAVVNGRTYYYRVRSVNIQTTPWRESLDSDVVSAAPRDLTPPDKPTGLTVVPGVGRVFLTWNENKEKDLAGYFVYRSTRSGRDYERLTDKLLMRTTFSDESARSGATYYYTVTAVDLAGNESARSAEKKAHVEKYR